MIYLDHSATTPTDSRVVEAILPYFTEVYGNASSTHQAGHAAEQAVEILRVTIGLKTTFQDVDVTGNALTLWIERLRVPQHVTLS